MRSRGESSIKSPYEDFFVDFVFFDFFFMAMVVILVFIRH